MRVVAALALMCATGLAHAQVAGNCSSLSQPRSMPVQPTVVAPIAPELVAPTHQLGAPTGVLSQAFDESLAVDQVLYRIKLDGCPDVASIAPVAPVVPAVTEVPSVASGSTAPEAAAATNDAAAYKPQTEFDNTPWRFDMSQNGKNMTADEFTAWMKAKGVRIATGAAKQAAPASSTVTVDGEVVPAAAPSTGEATPPSSDGAPTETPVPATSTDSATGQPAVIPASEAGITEATASDGTTGVDPDANAGEAAETVAKPEDEASDESPTP